MNLAKLLTSARTREDGFDLSIPEDWHQGRTAYGGLSAALALAGAQQVGGGELPPLRSAQVSFVGPLSGPVEVRARVLRKGRNATWIAAEVLRDGEVGLLASFAFMGAIDSVVAFDERPAPAGVIPPEEARAVPTERSPLFLQHHFDVRYALPRGEGPKRPEAVWWARLHEGGDAAAIDPMVHLLACADALPPGVMPLLPPRAPVSSMTWHCNLLDPKPATRDGWWLIRVASDYARSGGASEAIDIWNADGVPVLASMQSVAVFG